MPHAACVRFIAAIACLACACGLLDDPDKTKQLEQKVAALEKQLAEKATQERLRGNDLDECLFEAEARYWRYVKLNGRETKPGLYRAKSYVWEQAARDKANAIEECKARVK